MSEQQQHSCTLTASLLWSCLGNEQMIQPHSLSLVILVSCVILVLCWNELILPVNAEQTAQDLLSNAQHNIPGGKKNVILGYAVGYQENIIRRYITSFQKYTTSIDDVVLFTSVAVNSSVFIRPSNVCIIRVAESTNNQKSSHYMRFIKIYSFLKSTKHKHTYSKVISTDVRDVLFQDNPFDQINASMGVITFNEPELLAGNPWNQDWVGAWYGKEFVQSLILQNFTVINVGITMGNFDDMLVYYDLYTKELSKLLEEAKHASPERKAWELSGIDTAVHYNIILVQLPSHNITTSIVAVGQGHSTHRLRFPLNRDESGRLLNDNDELFAIVHQLDRKSTSHLWQSYLKHGDLLPRAQKQPSKHVKQPMKKRHEKKLAKTSFNNKRPQKFNDKLEKLV